MRHNPSYTDPSPAQSGNPDLDRMVQQRSGGYINEQALLRALNMQRVLSGRDPAKSIDEAIGGGVRPVTQTETPPLQVDPRLFAGRPGARAQQQTSSGDSGLSGVANAIASAFGQLGKQQPKQQGVPLPRPRPP